MAQARWSPLTDKQISDDILITYTIIHFVTNISRHPNLVTISSFNILLSGLGKSTLINSLFLTNLYEDREVPEAAVKAGQTVSIEASTVEIEERGVKELVQIFS